MLVAPTAPNVVPTEPRTHPSPQPKSRAVRPLALFLAGALLLPGCTGAQTPEGVSSGEARGAAVGAVSPSVRIDTARLNRDLGVLAHDSMEGRLVGTPGSARARAFLVERLREIGVEPLGPGIAGGAAAPETAGYGVSFDATRAQDTAPVQGVNLVGRIPGTGPGAPVIVLGAHYDHLGIRDGEVFNGADDNASGTAAVLAIAEQLQTARPTHTVVVALFDAEEGGLRGARAFVAAPPVPLGDVALMVNLDMVGRNEAGELYAVGTYHRPSLLPLVEGVAEGAPVTLLTGHDRPDLPPGDDWTNASDHGPFHQAGVPFLYFGVEDHPDYHQPTDTADGIQPDFHAAATETVLRVLEAADRALRQRPGGWR